MAVPLEESGLHVGGEHGKGLMSCKARRAVGRPSFGADVMARDVAMAGTVEPPAVTDPFRGAVEAEVTLGLGTGGLRGPSLAPALAP
jgi:hypothetical protein